MRDRLAGELTTRELRLMELARALAGQPRILLLDETLAGLGHGEVDELIGIIRRLAQEGITIVIIEHTMQAMVRLVDRFVVLDHGAVLVEGAPEDGDARSARDRGLSRQEVERLCCGLRAQRRLLRGAGAARRVDHGRRRPVRLDRRPERRRQDHAVQDDLRHRPADGRQHPLRGCRSAAGRAGHARPHLGIAHVPEGRQVFPSLTVMENLEMGAYTEAGRRDWKHNLERIYAWLPVLAERRAQLAGTLSGGEQQMLAIGRGLASSPKLLMLDEPSMGLAPTIADFIFERLMEIRRDAQLTILLVEQRVAEALESADHGYVLEAGRVVLEGTATTLRADDRVRQAYLGM